MLLINILNGILLTTSNELTAVYFMRLIQTLLVMVQSVW